MTHDQWLNGIAQDARERIKTYLDKPRHSIATLAKKSGLAYNTIKVFLNNPDRLPDLTTISRLIQAINGYQGFMKMLKDHDREGLQISGYDQDNDAVETNTVFNDFLDDPIAARIIGLFYCKRGSNRQEVKDLLGETGISQLNMMIAAGLLSEKGNLIKAIYPSYVIKDSRAACRFIQSHMQFFDPTHLGHRTATISVLSESISDQALELCFQKNTKHLREISDIIEKNPGRNRYYLTLAANLYD